MSEMKHTPGPWSCFYKPKYDEWHASLPMANCGMKLALAPDGIQSENREADAHLIGAAPEMLEALKATRGHVLWICEHNERVNGGRRSEEDRRDLEQIDAAIAKAQGRQP